MERIILKLRNIMKILFQNLKLHPQAIVKVHAQVHVKSHLQVYVKTHTEAYVKV